jgi:hypothetical protein
VCGCLDCPGTFGQFIKSGFEVVVGNVGVVVGRVVEDVVEGFGLFPVFESQVTLSGKSHHP